MKTPTPHNTGDIRCLGTKSDEDLAREWIRPKGYIWHSTDEVAEDQARRSAIVRELGKDRLEFLVFKIKTEERLEKLEEQTEQHKKDIYSLGKELYFPKPWYKRVWNYCNIPMPNLFLLTGFCISIFTVAWLLWCFHLIVTKM